VRKEFRATAESRNRPLLVAEAMVDADVVIEGVIAEGKLLTLTTAEALEQGVADFRALNIDEVLEAISLSGAEVRRAEVNWAEAFVRLLTNPVVSSLLLSVGLLGILVEIRTPGVGVPGIAGLTSLALFLGGHWIVQLAGWEELLLVTLGVILMLVEVLVIPGFGVAGVAGIAALLGGLTLTLIGEGASVPAISGAIVRVTISMVAALVAGLLLMRLMTRTPFARRLVLDTDMDAAEGWESTPEREHQLVGARGRSHTALRPAGIADIGGERVDVVSEGEMIEPGAAVLVTRVDGNRVVVRRLHTTTESV
jgi:membrane-bound serine protease (ClpP class)